MDRLSSDSFETLAQDQPLARLVETGSGQKTTPQAIALALEGSVALHLAESFPDDHMKLHNHLSGTLSPQGTHRRPTALTTRMLSPMVRR